MEGGKPAHAAWQSYRLNILMQIEANMSQAHQCPSLREWEVIRHD
jgi:hypothetical protein